MTDNPELTRDDERHEAKVRGLERLLVASQKATEHWEGAYTREVAAHGRTERALSALTRTIVDNPLTSTNTVDNPKEQS